MNEVRRFNAGDLPWLGLFIAAGLIVGGWLLGSQIKATRLADRYVTVKGLVERTVKSDLAIWPLSYKEAGDDLSALYAKTENDKKTILDFLDHQQITVRTPRVDRIAAAAQKTMQLLQKGIVLTSNPGQGLAYKFMGLNSIKPDMITEATRNARAAAARFASDSGSKVGSIRQANQGFFSILPTDQASETSEGNFSADSSLMKTVRVVTTVQYYLDQ